MAAVFVTGDGCGLRIKARRRIQPNKSRLYCCLSFYFHLNSFKMAVHKQQDGVPCWQVGVMSLHLSTIEVFNVFI